MFPFRTANAKIPSRRQDSSNEPSSTSPPDAHPNRRQFYSIPADFLLPTSQWRTPPPSASLTPKNSTAVCSPESFTTLRDKVLVYAQTGLWPGISERGLTAEQLRCGGYNRIIAFSRNGYHPDPFWRGVEEKEEFVIRIPWQTYFPSAYPSAAENWYASVRGEIC